MKVRGMSIYGSPPPGAPGNRSRGAKRHEIPKSIEGHRTPATAASPGLTAARCAPRSSASNDGLVSKRQLDLRLCGARPPTITSSRCPGVAGLLSGAFSMAAGEYVSMRSQREMFRAPDRRRARRAGALSSRRGGGAGADLRGAWIAQARRRAHGAARSSPTRRARSTRWRARSWDWIRQELGFAVGRGAVVVSIVLGRRDDPAPALHHRHGSAALRIAIGTRGCGAVSAWARR